MSNLSLRPADAAPGERWTPDRDVAALAGLAVPRDIRRTIGAMMNEGIINDYDCVGTTTQRTGPAYRVQKDTAPRGNRGGTQEVTGYLLNDAATLLVLTRLRTPDAERAIVSVIAGMQKNMGALLAAAESRLPALLEAAREEGRQEGTQATTLLLADPRPAFRADCQIPRAVEGMRALLAGDPKFYANNGTLMTVFWHADGDVSIRKARALDLVIRLSELARWEKVNRHERPEPSEPSGRVVRILMADCEWAGPMPSTIYETRLTRTLATWRPGSTISLYQVLSVVTSSQRPSKRLVPWAIEECTKRGWTLEKKSKPGRDGLQQEVTLPPAS